MVEDNKICPKCKGEMERGELRDENYFTASAQEWSSPSSGFIGFTGKGIVIKSYRCTKCGFLENYAIKTDTKENKLK